MKVTTHAVWQMTDNPTEYILLEENYYEYQGPIAQAGKDGPDYGDVSKAAKKSAQLSQELGLAQLDWAKEQWADQKSLLDSVLSTQVDIQEANRIRAEEAQQRYEEVYQPIEDQLIADIERYSTPERVEYDAARAVSDVSQAFEAQREMATRNLESYGIDPSQTRYEGLDRTMRAQEAVAQAQAANQSRLTSENIGRALRSEAINIGRGYPGDVGSAYGTALAAGTGAVGNINQTVQTGSAARNITPYLGAGNTAIANWGTNVGAYGDYQAQQSAGFGKGAGMLAGGALGFMAGGPMGAVTGASMMAGADGGLIEGPGGTKSDAIPMNVSDTEYIIPAEVVLRKGTEFFDRLVQKTREGIPQPDQVAPQGQITSTSTAAQQAIPMGGQ